MISKWFIGVNAKSKGFITGWSEDSYYSYRRNDNPMNIVAKPSFTKQSALATGYDTKAEADAVVAEYIKEAEKGEKQAQAKLDKVNAHKDIWDTLKFDDKIKFCKAVEPKVSYPETRSYNNQSYMQDVYFGNNYGGSKKWTQEEKKAITNNIDWDREVKHNTAYVQLFVNRITFCKEKMLVREQEIEIKFMDRERRKLTWTNREGNDTVGDYCNCCGGAVPNVPQLHIQGNRYGEYTIICGICMGRLAQESKIQVSKIPAEVLEHYQADRFLRSMD